MGSFSATVDGPLAMPAQVSLTEGQERYLRDSGILVPTAMTVRLLIDTGSKRSCLIPAIIQRLDPDLLGRVIVETSLNSVRTGLYWVRVDFPETSLAPIPELAVARLNLPPSLSAYHGVIGRDLLSQWESFLWEGRRGRLTICDRRARLFGWLPR